jgi:hypothetical protein
MAKKSGQMPGFENKSGHEKVRKYKALRTFCPLSHFYSLLNAKRKNYILYIIGIKSGQMGRALFFTKIGGML